MNVDKMTDEAVREFLKDLIEALDELDNKNFFGTEGWRHFLQI